jgi:acyl dehydratase
LEAGAKLVLLRKEFPMSKSVEEIFAEARKTIGKETATVKGRYPVEYDPIRRTCHMVDDTNPLFLDPEYAKTTKYGAVICPPAMVNYFAGNGIWPPSEGPVFPEVPSAGDRRINLTVEAEWFKPVKVGDQLSMKFRVADVYMKGIGLDPKAFWVVLETIITNQDGDVVCIERNIGLRHRTPEQVKAAREAGEE